MKSNRLFLEMLILIALICAGSYMAYTLGSSQGKQMAQQIKEGNP